MCLLGLIHVSRCIEHGDEIPQPFIQASAQNAWAGLGSHLQIAAATSWQPGGAAVLYPVLGIGSGCGGGAAAVGRAALLGSCWCCWCGEFSAGLARHCQPLALQQHCPRAPTTGILPILSLALFQNISSNQLLCVTW